MSVDGVTSSYMACWQNANDDIDPNNDCDPYYTGNKAYYELYQSLGHYPVTAETISEMPYITDMCWLGNQLGNFCIPRE